MKRWIVFDAMGVIFEEGDDILKRMVPFLHQRGCLLDGEYIHSVYRRASLGEISSREYWNTLGLAGEYPSIETAYLDSWLQLDPQFPAAAERLSAEYFLAMLSNDIPDWSLYLRRRHGLEHFFQAAVISGEAGVRKPDPAIYRILLERVQAEGKDCIFIDDRLPNLESAAALGIVPVLMAREGHPADQEVRYRIRDLSELPDLAGRIFSAGKNP
jgi:HAD superfamily hydrolase (TIGR01509 family)